MTNTATLISLHETKLSDEIYAVLRDRELYIPKYEGQSKYLCYRRVLVDWLAVISERLKLSEGILHIGIALFDIILDKCGEVKNGYASLQLYALSCLWIATKLDERDDMIPRLSTLQVLLNDDNYYHEDFLAAELFIMQILNWRLMIPTAVQFVDYYLQDIIGDDDLHSGYPITNEDRARVYVRKYANYFMGVVIQDHTFNTYLPSLVCSASLAASRLCLKITPTWPLRMIKRTGYDKEVLQDCIEKLLRFHESDQGRCKQP